MTSTVERYRSRWLFAVAWIQDIDQITAAAAQVGARYGMTASQVLLHAALGDVPHPDAPGDVCGATDPRDDRRWCVLAPTHPGENHNRHAPDDGCQTWTAHEEHDPTVRLP